MNTLPENNNYTIEKLIYKHTLFPIYKPFVSFERAKIVKVEMGLATQNKIPTRLGITAGQVENPRALRFCPICVKNDRERYAETYWHRIHQLSGVLVCPTHYCFLENSLLRWGRESSSSFKLAEEFVPPSQPHYIDPNVRDHQILLKLANDFEWLLTQKNLCLNTGELRKKYFNLLLRKQLAYYNGMVRHNKLVNACNEYFSADLLRQIGRISEQDNWLTKLVEKHKQEILFHPVRHLLLITFLGLTAKEFFTSFTEFKTFGDPPYACLNKASEHYGEMRINKCEIYDHLSKGISTKGRPIAYFTCDCDFIYQRVGPDKSEEDKFNYSHVREYGQIWENKLAELWSDLTLSGVEISKRLGVSSLTTSRHAIRLNLPMNTENTRSLQGHSRY